MPKVYIPNVGARHDFSKAEEFGELVGVTSGLLKPFDSGFMVRAWEQVLADSGPDDSILVTSLNVMCMIGAAMFALKHSCLNLLIFLPKEEKYWRRSILLKE